MRRSKDNFVETVLAFYPYKVSRYPTQITKLASSCIFTHGGTSAVSRIKIVERG